MDKAPDARAVDDQIMALKNIALHPAFRELRHIVMAREEDCTITYEDAIQTQIVILQARPSLQQIRLVFADNPVKLAVALEANNWLATGMVGKDDALTVAWKKRLNLK